MRVILASRSPRRQELLKHILDSFSVQSSGADETLPAGVPPQDAVCLLARRKAESVQKTADADCVVLGSDTIVVSPDGAIFGIPESPAAAREMLRALSGRTHTVMTGVCLLGGGLNKAFCSQTKVRFSALSDAEIDDYIASGEPFDKAGGYGIQGKASKFIEAIDGDYYTVMGLPVAAVYRALKPYLYPAPDPNSGNFKKTVEK